MKMLHKVYIYYFAKYIVLLGQVYCITLPSILYYYAINTHHHPPQNPLQSRTHRHPSMDSQR